ncbi:MurR/RpiR family transcriptional regulator [Labrys sp. La1]|uniref:MurR/RpiR family transcriptional regulator n=1 Tax=Labrys sp. La1 TaxID=3404917 RepID=UPI003EC0F172
MAARLAGLSPAERRVADYFQAHREEVLITSAASLAQKAGTSDATVVRATHALGFASLDELRHALADELRQSLLPAQRLARTLDGIGDTLSDAFDAAITIQIEALGAIRRTVTPTLLQQAIDEFASAKRVLVFGIGPSSAIAEYFVFQLARFGFDSVRLCNTGLTFADDLRKLRSGDLIAMLAYSRVYTELSALLDEIERLELRSILLTDTLAARLAPRVGLVLQVPRGRADMLSLHTGTLGVLEALLVCLAKQRPSETMASLEALNQTREKLVGKPMDLPLSSS